MIRWVARAFRSITPAQAVGQLFLCNGEVTQVKNNLDIILPKSKTE
jgi:hypothetical protein